jgi:hypothetical protein
MGKTLAMMIRTAPTSWKWVKKMVSSLSLECMVHVMIGLEMQLARCTVKATTRHAD